MSRSSTFFWTVSVFPISSDVGIKGSFPKAVFVKGVAERGSSPTKASCFAFAKNRMISALHKWLCDWLTYLKYSARSVAIIAISIRWIMCSCCLRLRFWHMFSDWKAKEMEQQSQGTILLWVPGHLPFSNVLLFFFLIVSAYSSVVYHMFVPNLPFCSLNRNSVLKLLVTCAETLAPSSSANLCEMGRSGAVCVSLGSVRRATGEQCYI